MIAPFVLLNIVLRFKNWYQKMVFLNKGLGGEKWLYQYCKLSNSFFLAFCSILTKLISFHANNMLHICKSILHHIYTFVIWLPQNYRQKLKYRTKSLQYSKKNATFARDFGKKRCKSENSQVCLKQHLMHYFPKEYNSFGKSFSVMPFSRIFHCVRNTINIAGAVSILEIRKSPE